MVSVLSITSLPRFHFEVICLLRRMVDPLFPIITILQAWYYLQRASPNVAGRKAVGCFAVDIFYSTQEMKDPGGARKP